MNLSKFFIDRPIFAGVLSLLMLIAGLLALRGLPISEYPEVVPPSIVVRAQYREVKLGSHVDGLRIVTEGLRAGDRVIVNGLQRVRPGAPVAPKSVPMDARPELQARGAAAAQS